MTTKILKSTERGQITLPKKWRDSVGTNNYLVYILKDKLVLVPLQLDMGQDEEIIFDADRENKGKGVSVDSMIKVLQKSFEVKRIARRNEKKYKKTASK